MASSLFSREPHSEAMKPAKIVPSLFTSSLFIHVLVPSPFPLITIIGSFAIPLSRLSPMSLGYMLFKALDPPLVVFMDIFHTMCIT
jgi:hypothetical protein